MWEYGKGQSDRQTDRQTQRRLTAVTNIHFASVTPHAKCNKRVGDILLLESMLWVAFSAFTLLIGWQEGHSAGKNIHLKGSLSEYLKAVALPGSGAREHKTTWNFLSHVKWREIIHRTRFTIAATELPQLLSQNTNMFGDATSQKIESA